MREEGECVREEGTVCKGGGCVCVREEGTVCEGGGEV